MEYVRRVDFAAIDSSGADERTTQNMLDQTTGSENLAVNCIKTPPGGGSPAGIIYTMWNRCFISSVGR